MKKKKNYEKSLTLKTLFLVLKRNIISILSFTAVFFLCGGLYVGKFMEKKYQTSGQLFNKAIITTSVLDTLTDTFKSDKIIDDVVIKLKDDNIKHSNGKNIIKSEIVNKFSLPATNNSAYVTISFIGNDRTCAKEILNTTFSVVIDYLKNNSNLSFFSGLAVSKSASNPVDVSNAKKYLVALPLVGFVLAYGTSFVIDFKYDLIYDIDDIKDLDTNVLELKYVERKKGKNE